MKYKKCVECSTWRRYRRVQAYRASVQHEHVYLWIWFWNLFR
jgi:hypothetical protein